MTEAGAARPVQQLRPGAEAMRASSRRGGMAADGPVPQAWRRRCRFGLAESVDLRGLHAVSEIAEEDHDATELQESEKVLGIALPPDVDATVALEPSK